MVNKKGVLRIVEVTIACMALIGFLIILNSRVVQTPPAPELDAIVYPVLETVAQNYTLRLDLFSSANQDRAKRQINESFQAIFKNYGYSSDVLFCIPAGNCDVTLLPASLKKKEVFVFERIIVAPPNASVYDIYSIRLYLSRQ